MLRSNPLSIGAAAFTLGILFLVLEERRGLLATGWIRLG